MTQVINRTYTAPNGMKLTIPDDIVREEGDKCWLASKGGLHKAFTDVMYGNNPIASLDAAKKWIYAKANAEVVTPKQNAVAATIPKTSVSEQLEKIIDQQYNGSRKEFSHRLKISYADLFKLTDQNFPITANIAAKLEAAGHRSAGYWLWLNKSIGKQPKNTPTNIEAAVPMKQFMQEVQRRANVSTMSKLAEVINVERGVFSKTATGKQLIGSQLSEALIKHKLATEEEIVKTNVRWLKEQIEEKSAVSDSANKNVFKGILPEPINGEGVAKFLRRTLDINGLEMDKCAHQLGVTRGTFYRAVSGRCFTHKTRNAFIRAGFGTLETWNQVLGISTTAKEPDPKTPIIEPLVTQLPSEASAAPQTTLEATLTDALKSLLSSIATQDVGIDVQFKLSVKRK